MKRVCTYNHVVLSRHIIIALFALLFIWQIPDEVIASWPYYTDTPHELLIDSRDYILQIPALSSEATRQRLIQQAGLQGNVENLITLSGDSNTFTTLLVDTLSKYGMMGDGRFALEAILDAAKIFLEPDQQRRGDALIQRFQDWNFKRNPELYSELKKEMADVLEFRNTLRAVLASHLHIPSDAIYVIVPVVSGSRIEVKIQYPLSRIPELTPLFPLLDDYTEITVSLSKTRAEELIQQHK